ncbi:Short-chain dehydrogenase/reductase SDR [Penicillium concentricum]|uniref:Short-chain dehydrogenase/reductase SDR n=1 Tax=Penicillium concentricum TaxID=293559 RepID=A0A9W9VC13_9EURO|nr:Short-chain dehydrogenase/reductase SDR [Penicillium concentricum]KAJ5375159.1 Short-chain dehydrogenase/reductase SDR [Penicillium concentricum]
MGPRTGPKAQPIYGLGWVGLWALWAGAEGSFLVCPLRAPSTTSLQGKAGIVTGSNTGLAYQASAQLLKLGLPHLILAVRSLSKGEIARNSLLVSLPKSIKPPVVEVWELDLENYSSITSFVRRLQQSGICIDFALLNAGVASFNYTQALSTSHDTALLTLLLLPVLNKQDVVNPTCPRSVISIVGSEAAAWAKFKESQVSTAKSHPLIKVLDDKTHFDMGDRYYTSNLLYQLFFLELFRSHRYVSQGAILSPVNPGFCYGSELHSRAEGALGKVFSGMKRVVGRSVSMGAQTLVHAAVLAGESEDGRYLSDCKVAPFSGYGESCAGRKMQAQVWEETVGDLNRVMNIDSLLAEI